MASILIIKNCSKLLKSLLDVIIALQNKIIIETRWMFIKQKNIIIQTRWLSIKQKIINEQSLLQLLIFDLQQKLC